MILLVAAILIIVVILIIVIYCISIIKPTIFNTIKYNVLLIVNRKKSVKVVLLKSEPDIEPSKVNNLGDTTTTTSTFSDTFSK